MTFKCYLIIGYYCPDDYISNNTLTHLIICILRFYPKTCDVIRPFLPPLSVFVTALCVGAPLAINVKSVMSPFGLTMLFLIIAFHLSSFFAGYFFTGIFFHKAPDVKALQRTLSFETGCTLPHNQN